MTEALFEEFEPAAREQWLDAVLKSLGSETVDSLITKTYEGINIHPLPQADDLAGIQHHLSLPGKFTFVRGTTAGGYRARPWLITGEIDLSDPREFNRTQRDALANGATAIALPKRLRLNNVSDLRLALADIDVTRFPIFLQSAEHAPEVYNLLCQAYDAEALAKFSGCIGYDPLNVLAQTGSMPDEAFERLAAHVETAAYHSPELGSIAVSTATYHAAGANAVQELALAIATGVAYLRALNDRGLAVENVAPKLHFFLSIGENFFMEVAKFRAIKLLWAQVLRAFSLRQNIYIHARSGTRNKSRLDAHVNLLRLTTEALSAAIGGVDSIQLAPFDQPLGASDDFSRRLSRNLQLILGEELRLVELIDPAGGAWHVEKLTDQLARAAWSRFQRIEADGGLVASLRLGALQAEIEAVAEQRRRYMASGDAVLVGVNRYVDPAAAPQRNDMADESISDSANIHPLRSRRLAEPYEARLSDSGSGS